MSSESSVVDQSPRRSTSTNEATSHINKNKSVPQGHPQQPTPNDSVASAVVASALASSSYSELLPDETNAIRPASARAPPKGGEDVFNDGKDINGDDYSDEEDEYETPPAIGQTISSGTHRNHQPSSSKASRVSSHNHSVGDSTVLSSPPWLHQHGHNTAANAPGRAVPPSTKRFVHPVLGVPLPSPNTDDDVTTTSDELGIDELLAQFYGGAKILPTRPKPTVSASLTKKGQSTSTAFQQQHPVSSASHEDDAASVSSSDVGVEALVMDGVFEAEMLLREQRHSARMERAFGQQATASPNHNGPVPATESRRGPSPHSHISVTHFATSNRDDTGTGGALQHPIGRIGDLTPREVLTVLMNMGEKDEGNGGIKNRNMEDLLHPFISDADLAALDNYASMKEQSRIHEEERSRLRGQLNVAILGSNVGDGNEDVESHQTIRSAKQLRLKDRAISSLYKTVAALREEAGHLQHEYAEYASTVQGSLHDIASRNLELQLVKQRQDAKYDAYIHGQRRWIDRDIHEFCDEDLPAKLARIEGTFGSHHISFLEDIGATSAERFRAENKQLVRSTETNLLRLLHEDSIQRVQRMEGRLVRKLYSGLFTDILSQFMAGNNNHRGSNLASQESGGEDGGGLLSNEGGVQEDTSSMSPRRRNRKNEKNASLMNIPPIMRKVVDAECSDRLKRITSEVSTTVAPRARHTLEQRLRTSVQGGLQDLHRKLEVVLQSPSAHILTTFRRELTTSVEHAQGELEAIRAECDSDRQQRQKVLLSALDVMCTNFDKIAAGTRIINKNLDPTGAGPGGASLHSPSGGGGLEWGSEKDASLNSIIFGNSNNNASFINNGDDDVSNTTLHNPHTDAAMLAKLSSEVSVRHRRLVERRRAARERMKSEHGPYVAPGNIGYRRKWMEEELGTDSEFEEDQRIIQAERETRVLKDLHREIAELQLQFRTNATMLESSETLGREAVEDAEITSRNHVINAGLNWDYGEMDSGKPMISPFGNNNNSTNRQTRIFVDKGNKRGKMASLRKAVYARSMRRRRVLQKRVAEARAAQIKRAAAGNEGGNKRRALKFSSKGSTPQRNHNQQHRVSSAVSTENPATPATPGSGGAFRLQSPAVSTPTAPLQHHLPPQQHRDNNAERNAQINAIRAELEQLKRDERERERREQARNRRVAEDPDGGPYGYSRHELQALQELRRLRQTPNTNPTMTHRGLITAGGDYDYSTGALPQQQPITNRKPSSSHSPHRSMSPGSAVSYPYHNPPSRGGYHTGLPPSARQTSAVPKATPFFGDTPVPSHHHHQQRPPVRSSYYNSNKSRHSHQHEDSSPPPAAQLKRFINRAEVGRVGLGAPPSSVGSSRTTTPRGGGTRSGVGGSVNKALLNPNQGGLALRESAYKPLTNGGSRWK